MKLELNRPQRVLLVDDEPTSINLLADLLEDKYGVLVANSGEKALALLQERKTPLPDLILLDIKMPGIDGYEVCRRLKSDPRTSDIPVIFVTAQDSDSEEELGLNLGAVDYITKPFSPAIVKARVRTQMRLKLKTDLLEKLSSIDGLTQVANRRCFDETLELQVARHQRNQQPLGLVMLDIDYFKPFNDHYGHGRGDECLTEVAAALAGVLKRPDDLLARYGGEEFAAILPNTDIQGVRKIAENLRAAVEALQLPHEYSACAPHVTVSCGGISQTPDATSLPCCLLEQADRALYQAKEQGRNTCVVD